MAAPGEKFLYYHYDPSTAAAVIFVVLFAGCTIGHGVQLFLKKTWFFIPFLIGGFFEVIGYIGRVLSSREPSGDWTLGPYLIQSLFLLLAPALFAASIYMVLGRIIRLVDGERHSIIRAKWLTKIFVGGDVLSFLAQSGGGGLLAQAKTANAVKLGENVIVAGLGIQVGFFAFFCVAAGIFHRRIAKFPTTRSQTVNVPWVKFLYCLYLVSGLILIRSVFRMIEYAMGSDGVLLQSETYLYVFDAALMFLAMLAFNIFHPGRIISHGHVSSGSGSDTELGGVEYVDPTQAKHTSSR